MPQFTVLSSQAAPGFLPAAQAAHDLRNLLATLGLHVETLQRLAGPGGAKAGAAAHALLERSAGLCNSAIDREAIGDGCPRRRGVDLLQSARQCADLLAPNAPKGFSFQIESGGPASVLADPDEVFRILFNLLSNAVAVARRRPNVLTSVTVSIVTDAAMVTLSVADNGPGLPAGVRSRLFGPRTRRLQAPSHGYGLAIAREFAELNGGTLVLVPSSKGTTFALQLPAFLSVLAQDGTRSLRSRAMAS
jgi:signal transduction histidine kinase